MPSEVNIVRGTSLSLSIYIEDEDGDAIDLTGYSSISLYADKALNATAPTLEKSASSVAASAGLVNFSLAPSDTSSLATGQYLAEVHWTIGTAQGRSTQPFYFNIHQRVKA